MPVFYIVHRNWKDTAYPNETREHWNMRQNRNHRKAMRRGRHG